MTARASALVVTALMVAACGERTPAPPPELDTQWEVPPGDPLEHAAAGFAKVLCSALFITGRDLAAAAEEDGYFVAARSARALVRDTLVDRARRAVTVTAPNGARRTARFFGDQGCVTLPPGADSVSFTPVANPAAGTADAPWPVGDVLPDTPLPADVDTARLAAAVAAVFEQPEALTAAFLVVHRGRLIAERYGPGVDRDMRLPSWSMGKSVVATLIGRLAYEGVYDLWQRAPIDQWDRAGDPRRDIRVVDLLRMSSGLRFVAPQDPGFDSTRGYPDHVYVYTGAIDAVRWSLTRPSQWPPNTVGRYRNSDPLALTHLVAQAARARGVDPLVFPRRLLFDRIGMRGFLVETDAYGNLLFNGYDFAPARDWARLGLLYLQDGVWQGERLLPVGWVDFVRTPAPAWTQPRYGGMFWLNRTGVFPVPPDAFHMAGAGGQVTLIIPTHDLVVVRMGHYKGSAADEAGLNRALTLLIQAVPRARPEWSP